jgi:hypothetical protein
MDAGYCQAGDMNPLVTWIGYPTKTDAAGTYSLVMGTF